jgi:hypothetical protein
MSKKMLALFVFGWLVAFQAPPTQAYYVRVDDNGTIEMFQDQVLGEETTTAELEKKAETPKEERKPEKVVSPNEKTELRIKTLDKNKTEVGVNGEKKSVERLQVDFKNTNGDVRKAEMEKELMLKESRKNNQSSDAPNKKEIMERTEATANTEMEKKRLEFQEKNRELGADISERREAVEAKQAELEELKKAQEDGTPLSEEDRERVQELAAEIKEDRAKVEELTEKRKEKLLKLRDAIQDGQRELQLEGENGVKARFSQGAEFVIDPENGSVTVINPNGKEHELRNFPDEVVEKIKARQDLVTGENAEVEVEIDDNGEVKQRVKNVQIRKRLFGFIPRQVNVEAVVDDSTGEVTVEETEQGVVDQFLNVLSF